MKSYRLLENSKSSQESVLAGTLGQQNAIELAKGLTLHCSREEIVVLRSELKKLPGGDFDSNHKYSGSCGTMAQFAKEQTMLASLVNRLFRP